MCKKLYLLLVLLFLITVSSFSQTSMPVVEWARTYGGAQIDIGQSVIVTADNKYVICGGTNSQDNDTLPRPTKLDALIIKTDENGNIIWKRTYGGNGDDFATKIIQTMDGGFIIAGNSKSSDGVFSTNKGGVDAWILKLDSLGLFEWQKIYGGSKLDEARGIIQDDKGNYIFSINSDSNDGDFLGGQPDIVWLFKINNTGDVIWKNKYKGSRTQYAYDLIKYDNKYCLLVGETSSIDGDFKGVLGDFIIKVDIDGNTLWLKSFSSPYTSTSTLNGYNSVIVTKTGDIMAFGYAYAFFNSEQPLHYYADYFLTKMNKDGNLIWSKMYGGLDTDVGESILQLPTGEFIGTGFTASKEGDIDSNCLHNNSQGIWTIKLDSVSKIIWKICLGGSKVDAPRDAVLTNDGAILITGDTHSSDGTFSKSYGSYDIPLIKLRDVIKTATYDNKNALQGFMFYPNPVNDNLTIENNTIGILKVQLVNALGQILFSKSYNNGTYQIDCAQLPNGFYQLYVSDNNDAFTSKKLIIQK